VVKLLLEKGANPLLRDNHGSTALAVAAGNGHEAMVELLLEKVA
jgi:ankyrin repeat protein